MFRVAHTVLNANIFARKCRIFRMPFGLEYLYFPIPVIACVNLSFDEKGFLSLCHFCSISFSPEIHTDKWKLLFNSWNNWPKQFNREIGGNQLISNYAPILRGIQLRCWSTMTRGSFHGVSNHEAPTPSTWFYEHPSFSHTVIELTTFANRTNELNKKNKNQRHRDSIKRSAK